VDIPGSIGAIRYAINYYFLIVIFLVCIPKY